MASVNFNAGAVAGKNGEPMPGGQHSGGENQLFPAGTCFTDAGVYAAFPCFSLTNHFAAAASARSSRLAR